MTKKQKEEHRAAELRKQALLASGVQIEGLQQQQTTGHAPKKVVYNNRKKKGPDSVTASGPATREPSPVRELPPPVAKAEPPKEQAPEKSGSVKDDWDASSGDEAPQAEGDVKDSWDDSSEDEANKSKAKPARTFCLFILWHCIHCRGR